MHNIVRDPYRHRHWILLLLFLIGIQSLQAANHPRRIALVIGNGAYPNIGALANPPNDARLMADTLRKLDFEVIEKVNVTQKTMKRAIKAFGDRLNAAGKDAVGVFYYAGHGVQVEGQNYLIPINVEIQDEADVDIEAVAVRAVLQNMEYAGNNMNIIIMDACRNNPFKRGFRSAARGLARMDAAKGTLIAYATAPGDVAFDGTGQNSPYTAALAANMQLPDITIERMFKRVRNAVVQQTNSAQVPWESSSLIGGEFYFGGKPETASPPVQTATVSVASDASGEHERLFWSHVVADPSVEMYEAYLQQFPNGFYTLLAEIKIKQLKNSSETSMNRVVAKEPTVSKSEIALSDSATDKSMDPVNPEVQEVASLAEGLNLTGTFVPDEGFEDLVLVQSGKKVSGYIGTNDSTLEGHVEGNRIVFTFMYSKSGYGHRKGTGEFTISPDGNRLTGYRRGGGFPKSSDWNLTREQ